MDQLGAIAPQYLADIDGIDAVRQLVPDAPALRRLHASTSVCAAPWDIAIPERRATPFLGRAEEMAALQAWLSGPEPVAVQRISGGAGTGKTRLAIELCAWAEVRGWDAGFIATDAVSCLTKRRRSSPSLVVLDEMEPPPAAWVGDQRTDDPPLRILAIDRNSEPIAAGVAEPLRLGGLRTNDEKLALLRQAMSLSAAEAGVRVCLPHGCMTLDIHEPLHLLMAGLIAPHAGLRVALSETPAVLAHRIAARERQRLERLAPILGLNASVLCHIAACVTLQAGCPLDAAGLLVHEEASALAFHLPASCDEVADAITDAMGSDRRDLLAPIGPQPVGGAFLINEIGSHAPEAQAGIIERALRRAPASVPLTVHRVAQDHADADAAHSALQWQRQIGP